MYATTSQGGHFGGNCQSLGCGTVFKIDTNGTYHVLYAFTGKGGSGDDGQPWGQLILDASGNLYGTALGDGNGVSGEIFKLDPAAKITVLHRFDTPQGGYSPVPIIMGTNGMLYGMGQWGGDESCNPDTLGCGTIFEITP